MQQHELPLPFPELTGDTPPLPARMVNEYVYCPRPVYLEWVQGEWAESADTTQGRHAHRRVDKASGTLPAPEDLEQEERIHARSLTLTSPKLGLVARLDLVETEDGCVIPVDYKRGSRPHVAHAAYAPERVQLCVQAMILEDHGYRCEEGVLYFVESRERVPVRFDDELREQTLSAISGLRLTTAGGRIPVPLDDSPKCPRCSLVGICLPDEVNFLKRQQTPPRAIAVGLTEALPMHVQAHRAKIGKSGELLEVTVEDKRVAAARIGEVSQLVLMGNVYVTTPTLHELMRREIPVSWHGYDGWFLGYSAGMGHKNVELRTAQYQASFDEQICLNLAKGWVKAKIHNCRILTRRNWRGESPADPVLLRLEQAQSAVRRAHTLAELLGAEGNGAAVYFGAFSNLITQQSVI